MDYKEAILSAVGQKIRSEREKLGIAQDTFASRIALDRSHYGKIERGAFNISLVTLVKIARGLGIPTAKLLVKELDEIELPETSA